MFNKSLRILFVFLFIVSPIFTLLFQPPMLFPSPSPAYAFLILLPYLSYIMIVIRFGITGLFILITVLTVALLVSFWIASIRDRSNNPLIERAKRYENIMAIFLMLLFVFRALVLPYIGESYGDKFVIMEKKTRQSILLKEIPLNGYGHLRLQEIKIKNNFPLPVIYKLPSITLCLYDIQEKKSRDFSVVYVDDINSGVKQVGSWVSYLPPVTPGISPKKVNDIIIIGTGKKGTAYLNDHWVSFLPNEASVYADAINSLIVKDNFNRREILPEELEKYDEFLLFKNIGLNNFDYCNNLNETDINKAEKIKIIK